MIRLLAVALVTPLVASLAVAQKDPLAPPLLKVTAEHMGKEFQKDTDAAVKKYLPPKPGRAGGVLIHITGVVAGVDAKASEVRLETGTVARIILHAKNIEGVKAGDKVQAEGTFRNYYLRNILIDCGQVKPAK